MVREVRRDVVWFGHDGEDRGRWDYEWEASRIICVNSQFIVQNDSGCSCWGPFDSHFDQYVEDCAERGEDIDPLILSPHWEGFKRLSWKTEIVEAFKSRSDCPNWILDL